MLLFSAGTIEWYLIGGTLSIALERVCVNEKLLVFTVGKEGGDKMETRVSLRSRLQDNHLNYSWLIYALKLRGVEVDKSTLSSAVNGTISGPRVPKIMEASHFVLDEYEKFMRSITV